LVNDFIHDFSPEKYRIKNKIKAAYTPVGENGLRKLLPRPAGLSVSAHARLRLSGGSFAMELNGNADAAQVI
jgi:hypothetical protein